MTVTLCETVAIWRRVDGYVWDGIQNIPESCRHLYSSFGGAKILSQQAKLWIPGSTATICHHCVKTCQDVAPNFDENTSGCFTITTLRLTLPFSSSSFERNTKWLSSLTHRTPLIWHPVTSFLFPKMKLKLKGRRFDTNEEIQAESQSAWHCDRKGLPGSVSEMEKVGLVSIYGRELLRGWWRPIGLMVSFMIFKTFGPE
jgi:hypothetical protein